jgi:uncharacterized protein YodC (DUF2158 family)
MKIGDIVQLKSGSPSMTVTDFDPKANGVKLLECSYFNDNKELVWVKIRQEALCTDFGILPNRP